MGGRKPTAICDETNGEISVPADVPKISVTNGPFERLGLPMFPNFKGAQLYNGDYAIYAALLHSDADYIVINEYDVVLPERFSDTIEMIMNKKLDLVGHPLNRQTSHWYWLRNIEKWYKFEFDTPSTDVEKFADFLLFPTVIVSRAFGLDLLSRRLEMARKLRAQPEVRDTWLFCEAFVGCEARRMQRNVGGLGHFVNASQFSFNRPIDGAEIGPPSKLIYHPVLFGERLVQKVQRLLADYKNRYGDQALEMLSKDGLRERYGRYIDGIL